MSATWLICVPTVPARAAALERMLARLLPQTLPFGGSVKVMGWLNTGTPRLAEIRDAMVAYADEQAWEYVSFFDDDDVPTGTYVHDIKAAIENRRPDHVGFWVEYYKDGVFQGDVEHSLRWPRWATLRCEPVKRMAEASDFQHNPLGERLEWEHGGMHFPKPVRFVRDFTHIDPIRTEIARWGRFADARPHAAEDRAWCRSLRDRLAGHLGSSEVFVNRVLYSYFWVPEGSVWDHPSKQLGSFTARPAIDHPNFFWHKESL
jgi:hypothetical protein